MKIRSGHGRFLFSVCLAAAALLDPKSAVTAGTKTQLRVAYSSISGAAVVTWFAVDKGFVRKERSRRRVDLCRRLPGDAIAAQRDHADRDSRHRAGLSRKRAWQRYGDDPGNGD